MGWPGAERVRAYQRSIVARIGSSGIRLVQDEVAPGILRLTLSSRLIRRMGLGSSCYLVGDLLVDSSFAHAGAALRSRLRGEPIHAIACTHNHEDHTGNAATLATDHRCPVYLCQAHRLWEEGVGRMALYRRLWWGEPAPIISLVEMPETIEGARAGLDVLRTPGHSQTHCVLFDRQSGAAFVGDLLISKGASAVMAHEDPYALAASLRQVAARDPAILLNGHGLALEQPQAQLLAKAERVEQAAARVLELTDAGVSPAQIARRVFAGGQARDRYLSWISGGEFSRARFVEACVRHRPGPA